MNQPEPPRKRFAPSLVAGVLAVMVSWALVILGVFVTGATFQAESFYCPALAAACLASAFVVEWILPSGESRSNLRCASWVLLAWAPYVLFVAAMQLDAPIVSARPMCGLGMMGLVFLILFSTPFVFGAAVAIAVASDRLRLHSAGRFMLLALLGVAMLSLALNLRRSHKADPAGYLASLPVAAVLGNDSDRFDGPGFVLEHRGPAAGAPGPETAAKGACVLRARVQPASPASAPETELSTSCSGVRVLRDAEHGFWVFQAPAPGGFWNTAIDAASEGIDPVRITVGRVSSSLRPPTPWSAMLAAGATGALAILAFARKVRRGAEAWTAARVAVHGGEGWVTFEDGTPPAHFAAAAALPTGLLLVLEPSLKAPHYREHGRADDRARFAAGTLADVRLAADTRIAGYHALASLALLLALAPLAASALAGFLG